MALLEINNKVYNIPNKAMEEIKKTINELNEENEKLNNIIKEMEKFLEEHDAIYTLNEFKKIQCKYKGEEK